MKKCTCSKQMYIHTYMYVHTPSLHLLGTQINKAVWFRLTDAASYVVRVLVLFLHLECLWLDKYIWVCVCAIVCHMRCVWMCCVSGMHVCVHVCMNCMYVGMHVCMNFRPWPLHAKPFTKVVLHLSDNKLPDLTREIWNRKDHTCVVLVASHEMKLW